MLSDCHAFADVNDVWLARCEHIWYRISCIGLSGWSVRLLLLCFILMNFPTCHRILNIVYSTTSSALNAIDFPYVNRGPDPACVRALRALLRICSATRDFTSRIGRGLYPCHKSSDLDYRIAQGFALMTSLDSFLVLEDFGKCCNHALLSQPVVAPRSCPSYVG